MKKAEAYWPLILLLAIIKFVLPIFLQHPVFELQRDEFLYYQQGQHPALGYLENPPLLSYLGSISSWFGGSVAWIKLWPCLFGAATVVVTCLIAAELGGKLFAQFLAGLGIISGAFMRIHFLFQPNVLDIFFWTLSAYFIIRYINDKKTIYLYWFCFSLALGFWGKYSVVFIAISLIFSLLLAGRRKIFIEKHFWTAIALSILIILPNVLWQYFHNWPLVHHMKELQETQLQYLNKKDFLIDQLLMLSPVILIWTGGLIWVFKNSNWRFIGVAYILVIILIMFGSGKSYYTLGAYPMLLAAGGVAWEQWLNKRIWKRYVLCGLILVPTILFIPVMLPIWKPEKLSKFYQSSGVAKSGILKWEDGKEHSLPQDFADMLGWKEIAEKTESFYSSLPDSVKKNTIIFGRHYGHAGGMIYYSKNISFKKKVYTDNGSFLLWIPQNIKFENLILVSRRMPDKNDEVFNHFSKATVVDSVTNPYSRQLGDKIIFFENIDSAGLQLATNGLMEMKKTFSQ
ncbi:MAG TPA: glycosyltransferase family 39 protein [Chitinophagaceae bacterium]|nr:glycosyltransferase family 39 protein [Chitinophagaceae bacterium]